jgi:hypothetical protein
MCSFQLRGKGDSVLPVAAGVGKTSLKWHLLNATTIPNEEQVKPLQNNDLPNNGGEALQCHFRNF